MDDSRPSSKNILLTVLLTTLLVGVGIGAIHTTVDGPEYEYQLSTELASNQSGELTAYNQLSSTEKAVFMQSVSQSQPVVISEDELEETRFSISSAEQTIVVYQGTPYTVTVDREYVE